MTWLMTHLFVAFYSTVYSTHRTCDMLVEGGRTRVRPILMTALATILAISPLAVQSRSSGLNVRIRLVPVDLHGYPARIWPGPALWVAPHLAPRSVSPFMSALRRIPLVKRLFPTPQPLDEAVTTPSVFRLTLLPRHGTSCPGVCTDATLDGGVRM